eukprot:CAMPEP_0170453778 /NCGR_PEP_ID=MMETSP0123-20130129/2254_1 /TAXON_ID=182087 /ORGANISM="Favella ehrenbergii, Strain Fehren 1" /LENGTH=89 /DNA_ID=CAMNT_0010716279 /DNA_START=410 /DNA_END=676 /DNA_ORIENTATION=-
MKALFAQVEIDLEKTQFESRVESGLQLAVAAHHADGQEDKSADLGYDEPKFVQFCSIIDAASQDFCVHISLAEVVHDRANRVNALFNVW